MPQSNQYKIRLLHVRCALQYCAKNPPKKFSRRRLTEGTEWVHEHLRFAFSKDE